MMTLEDFKAARKVLDGVISPTHLIHSPAFSKATGNQVYLKPENMQITGAYKLRGAYFKISTLTDEQKAKGLITASAGNHAQGVAFAAQAAGVKATIVMPTTTPLVKVNNTKDYGAEVVLFGHTHKALCDRDGPVWIVNPGSIGASPQGTYAVMEERRGELYCRTALAVD